ncbi:MAG TPA: triose-phosphate isomerase, partial [Opitutae bacterium]|nr:triose-phosphate isomerase [Opitutae bacterium]
AGNWKMNKNAVEAKQFIEELVVELGTQSDVGVVVCPPFTALESVARALEGSHYCAVGAQNMHPEPSGAYTGEVSAEMLRHLFVSYVILGHSERRAYFGETDDFIRQKVLVALENNLKPILCVGETLEQRDAGHMFDVVGHQLREGMRGVDASQLESFVLAYEPVWAIGTGRTATPEQAQEMHAFLRKQLAGQFSEDVAQKVRILYGGSAKPDNVEQLFRQEDVDGGLVGGASLEVRSFMKIIEVAHQLTEQEFATV